MTLPSISSSAKGWGNPKSSQPTLHVQNRIFTTETQRPQRIFCLSGDTAKQKLSVQKPWSPVRSNPRQRVAKPLRRHVNLSMLNVQRQMVLPHRGAEESVYEKCFCHTFNPRAYFRLSASPDRRKIISPLCELCVSVVNLGRLAPSPNWLWRVGDWRGQSIKPYRMPSLSPNPARIV